MKMALCLSGGGVKGAAHIGALKAFEEANIEFNYISGTSSGSIVAALYAVGYSSDEIYCLFKYNKLNEKLKENKNYLRTIYLGDYDIFVFSVKNFIPEYEYFIIGKYSKFRPIQKELILSNFDYLRTDPSHKIKDKYNLLYGILYKTDILKKELEKKYNRKIEDYEELSSPVILEKETFNFYE